jgi:hypothetical protein
MIYTSFPIQIEVFKYLKLLSTNALRRRFNASEYINHITLNSIYYNLSLLGQFMLDYGNKIV